MFLGKHQSVHTTQNKRISTQEVDLDDAPVIFIEEDSVSPFDLVYMASIDKGNITEMNSIFNPRSRQTTIQDEGTLNGSESDEVSILES